MNVLLFGRRFLRFMGGPKHCRYDSVSIFNPSEAQINYVIPSRNSIDDFQPHNFPIDKDAKAGVNYGIM